MRKTTLKTPEDAQDFIEFARDTHQQFYRYPGINTVVFSGDKPDWCDTPDEYVTGYDILMTRIC